MRDNAAIARFNGSFETTAEIHSGRLKATAEIQRSHSGYIMRFSEPDSLRGMEFAITGGVMTVSYKGMDFDFNRATLPSGNIARLTSAAVDALLAGDGLAANSAGNGALIVTGSIDSGGFTAELGEETGELRSLSIPDRGLEIAFRDFRFMR